MSPRALPDSIADDTQLQPNTANLLAYLNEKEGMGLLWDLLVVGFAGTHVRFMTYARTYYRILAPYMSAVVWEQGLTLTHYRVTDKEDWDAAKNKRRIVGPEGRPVRDGIHPYNRLPTMDQGNVINDAVIRVELEYMRE